MGHHKVILMAYGKEDVIGNWSLDKLEFLKKYIPAYLKATAKATHKYYIDGFAGRGKWIERNSGKIIDGSAAIALKYADLFTHIHLVEFEEERAEQLKKIAFECNAVKKTTIHIGDCNHHLPHIINTIHDKSPTFIFLDPSSDQLHWSTIVTLSKKRTELFILFPLNMTILRYLPKNGLLKPWAREHLDPLFGSNEWEAIYRTARLRRGELAQALLDLYTKNLQALGYKHINISRIFKNDGGQRLYYMIWVGKHPVGKKIMDTIFEQQPGQLELF